MSLYPVGTAEKVAAVDTTSTFADNLSLPIHRWFRYSAGFSAVWANRIIREQKEQGRVRILDPFAGCGTVLLEAEPCDISSIGIEAHPFVARVAQAKLCWRSDPDAFARHAYLVLEGAKRREMAVRQHARLLEKCFRPEALLRLEGIKEEWEERSDDSSISELTWLALISILRDCSPVGTAQWQYILPAKNKVKVIDPFEAFRAKIDLIRRDMQVRRRQVNGPPATLARDDARSCSSVPDNWAQLIITSPPYANNYDYADATRLEMTFLGQIDGWGDLQGAVRTHLIRSCTQHAARLNERVEEIVEDPLLSIIRDELSRTCNLLKAEREGHGGKKPYHAMVAAYFSDMARVWTALRRVSESGALVCFVVGDSAPYGIHVPVDEWLGRLAISAGFRSYSFEKTRDRNVKWKNRKHRVPLSEGRLWVQG